MPFSYPGDYHPHEKSSRECLERQIKNLKKRIEKLVANKFVILLELTNRAAVIIDASSEEAIKQARLCEPDSGWEHATASIIVRVPASRTARILAMGDYL